VLGLAEWGKEKVVQLLLALAGALVDRVKAGPRPVVSTARWC